MLCGSHVDRGTRMPLGGVVSDAGGDDAQAPQPFFRNALPFHGRWSAVVGCLVPAETATASTEPRLSSQGVERGGSEKIEERKSLHLQ